MPRTSTSFGPGNTAALQHGVYSQQVAAGALAEQAEAVAALDEQRREIETDLGGSAGLSRIRRDLVKRYLETQLIADYLGDNLRRLGPLTGKGKARAATTAYLQVLDRQVRLAQLIGLERTAKPVPSLREVLNAG